MILMSNLGVAEMHRATIAAVVTLWATTEAARELAALGVLRHDGGVLFSFCDSMVSKLLPGVISFFHAVIWPWAH